MGLEKHVPDVRDEIGHAVDHRLGIRCFGFVPTLSVRPLIRHIIPGMEDRLALRHARGVELRERAQADQRLANETAIAQIVERLAQRLVAVRHQLEGALW